MEGRAQAGIEVRVLGKVVGAHDDIDQALVDDVVEAFDQAAAVPRHAAKSDFALGLGFLGEFPPLGILHARHVVDRVIEVDV